MILATAILSIPTPTEVCHPISPDEHRKPNPPDTQPIRQAALPVRRLAEVLHAASFPNTSDDLISHASQLLKDRIKSELIKREIQQIRWITEPTNRGYPTQLGLMHLSTVQHMRLQMGRRHHENLGRENFNPGDSNDVMFPHRKPHPRFGCISTFSLFPGIPRKGWWSTLDWWKRPTRIARTAQASLRSTHPRKLSMIIVPVRLLILRAGSVSTKATKGNPSPASS